MPALWKRWVMGRWRVEQVSTKVRMEDGDDRSRVR